MTNHAQFLAEKRFGSLDGLRAISVVAVVWHHTAPNWVKGAWAHFGAQGVTLFFAISGFLITTLLLRERERTGGIDIKAFYLRRTLRIFPLYYGVLLLYIALVILLERNTPAGRAFFDNLIYFATYTSNIFVDLDGRVIFYFAWSLAAEEQFYLIWPSILLIAGTVSRASIVLYLTFAACVVGQWLGNRFFSAVPLAIVLGALLALTLHTSQGYRSIQTMLGQKWSLPLLSLALVLALAVPSSPAFVIHALFAGIVGACVIRRDHLGAAFLSLKPIAYVGSISYGIYMLHMLCKNAAVKLFSALKVSSPGGFEVFAATLVLAVIAASLSFKYYESIFLKMKHRHER